MAVSRELNAIQMLVEIYSLSELAAHVIGVDPLQNTLRQAITEKKREPTTAHFLLAALHLPVYLTTNYDCLFEDAFDTIHSVKPDVITHDPDVRAFLGDNPTSWDKALRNKTNGCFIIKLHGSVGKKGEHLILTRSDYRRHYRSNKLMLDLVKFLFGSRHTLFLGFSHRDPEVSRIIEDVIFTAENKRPPSTIPGFYSLQFDILPLILGRDRVGKRSLESCPHPFLENSSIGLSVLPGHNTRVPTMLCFAPHGGTL